MPEGMLLGIDVGTTFCKAGLVDSLGREFANGRVATPWRSVATGAEVDPAALLEAVVSAARQALAGVGEGEVAGVGVTSMAETGVLADGRGRPVVPSIVWYDSRGQNDAADLAQAVGRAAFIERTGLPPTELCSLAKYRWLRRHQPEAAAGRRWYNLAEWVVLGLGGDPICELSLASRTGMLDITTRSWWSEVMDWAQVPDGFMERPVPAGTPMGRVGAVLPAAKDAILTVAGHDHLCAAVGAGAVADGDVFDSCGTAEAFVRGAEPPVAADAIQRAVEGGVTVGWHVVEGRQALLGGFLSGGLLQRFLALLGVGPESFEELDEAAVAAPRGADGLMVEGLGGGQVGLTGIGAQPSPGLVWRAALEAVARQGLEVLSTIEFVAGPTERLVVTGGWARSRAVREIKEVEMGSFTVPDVQEAGTRGAALIGGVAAGMYPSVTGLPLPAHAPDQARSHTGGAGERVPRVGEAGETSPQRGDAP